MNFNTHYKEFKFLFSYCLFSILLSFLIAWSFKHKLILLITLPIWKTLNLIDFIYTQPSEAFFAFFNSCLFLSLFINLPYLVYNTYIFLKPGLYEYEDKKLKVLILKFLVCLFIGIFIIHQFINPVLYSFFSNFQSDELHHMPRIAELITYNLKLINILIILPAFWFLPYYIKFYAKKRDKIYFVYLILASLITPPDVISQIIITSGLILISELIIFITIYKNLNEK